MMNASACCHLEEGLRVRTFPRSRIGEESTRASSASPSNELASTKKLLESANSKKQSDAKTLQTDKTRIENELDKTSKELASTKAELQSVRESAQRANAAAGGAKALQAQATTHVRVKSCANQDPFSSGNLISWKLAYK